jgi:hypothetical protein
MDARPADCRFRLADEGKAYPRSSCTACGRSVTTGLGTSCAHAIPGSPPTTDDTGIMRQAAVALSDARRLWPARHPASGMIIGIEDDCRQTYERITAALDVITARLSQ